MTKTPSTPSAVEHWNTLLTAVEFPGFEFDVQIERGTYFLRVVCPEGVCNTTGAPLPWSGRKFRLSAHMTDGEFINTCFMAVMIAVEHETRERFKFMGASIFQSHLDVYKLVELAKSPDGIKERDHGPTPTEPREDSPDPAIGGEQVGAPAEAGAPAEGVERIEVFGADGLGVIQYPGRPHEIIDLDPGRRGILEAARREGREEARRLEEARRDDDITPFRWGTFGPFSMGEEAR